MRLRSIWISEYKNLEDFSLTFDGERFIDIFVGKNGTGKSNFFEAIVEILRHIYDSKSELAEIGFDYEIIYEIGGVEIKISKIADAFQINDRARRTVAQTPTPDNVLIYYSGHNETIRRTSDKYEAAFVARSRNWKSNEVRKFLNIGPEYKELLISVMLMQSENCTARQYLCEKLGIQVAKSVAKLSLSAPDFNHIPVDVADPSTFLWGAEGVSREFVELLLECIKEGYTPGEIYDRDADTYEIKINIDLFTAKFEGVPLSEIFFKFDNLKMLGMLSGLSIPLTLPNGEIAEIADFSDGQFQSVYIFALTELLKDRNCITLLDEPDSFLHPEWQFRFLGQVVDIADTQGAQTNHVLLNSHSAATLISHTENKIGLFDLKDNKVNFYTVPKHVAVEKLSEKLIIYTEKKQLLSIINAIQIENKPIFFTEGSIDPVIIKEAWQRLYEDDMPFIPFYGFSCSYLKQLLSDQRIHSEMNGLPVFGLFDFDKAFDHWNGLRGSVEVDSLEDGLVKKLTGKNAYGIMLPLPQNEDIRNQVVQDLATNTSFRGDSLCEIEHLFYGDEATEEFFEEEPAPGGGKMIVIKSDAQKERFAYEVVPTLDDEFFQVFQPMFEFVKRL